MLKSEWWFYSHSDFTWNQILENFTKGWVLEPVLAVLMRTLLVRHGLLIIQRKVDRETRYGRQNWKLSKCRLNFDLMLKCLVCALEWQDVLHWKRWIGEIIDHHNWPKILVNLALEKFPSKQGWSSLKKQFGWLCAYAFFWWHESAITIELSSASINISVVHANASFTSSMQGV